MTQRVLVTGGAGYVGSHCCKYLSEKGYEVIVADNLCRGYSDFVQWGPLEKVDIGNFDEIQHVLKRHRPDAVIHFAALAYVGESVRDPQLYYESNVCKTLTLLRAMISVEVSKLVFSSTCAVYGVPGQLPILEETPKNPINPYGRSKRMIELILKDYAATYNLSFVALRYFNAAGADFSGVIGEAHDPETHLIPLALEAHNPSKRLNVYGSDYETPDGTAIRDYIHVNDLASAHELSLRYLDGGHSSEYFNLGVGRGFSVFEVIEACRKATNRPIHYELAGRRAGDPPELVAEASRARNVLGWEPQIYDLNQIVQSAWNWSQKRGNY